MEILLSKPILIGLHLGLAILGIDAFIWLLGELVADVKALFRIKFAAVLGLIGFFLSWLAGGYYYVKFYGPLVKPIIKEGLAPWAHAIFMETKEHAFLFLIPMAITAVFVVFSIKDEAEREVMKKSFKIFVGLVAGLGLLVGAMGFIISAAARWGAA